MKYRYYIRIEKNCIRTPPVGAWLHSSQGHVSQLALLAVAWNHMLWWMTTQLRHCCYRNLFDLSIMLSNLNRPIRTLVETVWTTSFKNRVRGGIRFKSDLPPVWMNLCCCVVEFREFLVSRLQFWILKISALTEESCVCLERKRKRKQHFTGWCAKTLHKLQHSFSIFAWKIQNPDSFLSTKFTLVLRQRKV